VNQQAFALQPFPTTAGLDLRIDGSAVLRANILEVHYVVAGAVADVVLPPPVGQPRRRHGLWRATCFELFLALRGSHAYWEFNLAPSGDWNAYRFTGYRSGMEEEPALSSLPCACQSRPDVLALGVRLDLGAIFPDIPRLEAAVAATVLRRQAGMTYWALCHPGPEPDFHRRDAFRLQL
jgi:hypothetical protein